MMSGRLERKNRWFIPVKDRLHFATQPQALEGVLALISKLGVSRFRGLTAIHAGGGVGFAAIPLAKFFKTLVVFEPDEDNFEALCMNMQEAHSRESALTIRMLGALGGVRTGFCSMENPTPTDIGAHRVQSLGTGDIQVYRVDDLPEAKNVGLLHLSLNGYEHEALLGAEVTLRRDHPVLVLELAGKGSHYGRSDQDVLVLLERWGYEAAGKIHEHTVFIPREL